MTFAEFLAKHRYTAREDGAFTPIDGGRVYYGDEMQAKFEKSVEGIGCCTKCGWPELNAGTNFCWSCNWWETRLRAQDTTCVRIDGHHYTIGPEEFNTPSRFRGFGGRRFHIKFTDGRVVTTTNLWSQGRIPDWFRAELPDNAEFING